MMAAAQARGHAGPIGAASGVAAAGSMSSGGGIASKACVACATKAAASETGDRSSVTDQKLPSYSNSVHCRNESALGSRTPSTVSEAP
jgi:hypothetical protein